MSAIITGMTRKSARMSAEAAMALKSVSSEATVSTVVAPDHSPAANRDTGVNVRPRIAVVPVIVDWVGRIGVNTRLDRVSGLRGILVRDRRRSAQRLVLRRSHLRIRSRCRGVRIGGSHLRTQLRSVQD